jgi:hypothetical protein
VGNSNSSKNYKYLLSSKELSFLILINLIIYYINIHTYNKCLTQKVTNRRSAARIPWSEISTSGFNAGKVSQKNNTVKINLK